MTTSTEMPPAQATAPLPAPEQGSVSLMRLIERAATSPDFDVAKLEKLLDVKERWEANEARKAFTAAKAAFKAEAPRLLKNRKVAFPSQKGRTEYDHATLDAITEALSPVLAKHGLAFSWETTQNEAGLVRVACVLTHVLGHSERVALQAAADQSGSKNPIQAIGSTVTYLERYTLLAITGLATAEQDDDGAGSSTVLDAEQKDTLIATMREVGADTGKFMTYLGVESLDVLPAHRFEEAMTALRAKKRAAS